MVPKVEKVSLTGSGLNDRKSDTSMSREDHKFMEILQEGAKLRNGDY